MFIFYALILLIPVVLYWIHQKWIDEDAKVGVPGPKGWPLLGCILEIQPYLKAHNVFKMFHDYHEIYGETYQIRMGPSKLIVSRDPKVTEAIVNNPKFEKSNEYNTVKPWLGESLLVLEGERWHKKRKLITPAFHFQILERFIPMFEEHVEVFIEIIRKEMSNPKGIEIFSRFHAMTLDIISETSMGVQLKAQSGSQSPFIEANSKMVDLVDKRVFSGYLSIDWIFRLSSYYKVQTDNVALINDFVDKIIKQRYEKLLKEINHKSTDSLESEIKKRPALLDILLQAKVDGEPLSNEDIQAEVKTFMFAGHETTANSLTFTAYLLAKHPKVQEKLWNEIKSNSLNVTSDRLTTRSINSLPYMDNVIKEVLRLYPPAPMVLKKCVEDIRIGNVFIPAETTVGTNIFSGHRAEKYFKDPEIFDPDRFDNEITAEDRNPYAYQPFSSGLRNCIGQRFALFEIKTVLVKLLSTFEFELVDQDFEIDLIQSGTIKCRNGVPMKFKERQMREMLFE